MSYESPSPPNLAIANSAHQLRSNAEGLPTTGDPRAVSMTSYNRLLPVPRPTIVPPIILRTGHARRWQRSAKMLDTWDMVTAIAGLVRQSGVWGRGVAVRVKIGW